MPPKISSVIAALRTPAFCPEPEPPPDAAAVQLHCVPQQSGVVSPAVRP